MAAIEFTSKQQKTLIKELKADHRLRALLSSNGVLTRLQLDAVYSKDTSSERIKELLAVSSGWSQETFHRFQRCLRDVGRNDLVKSCMPAALPACRPAAIPPKEQLFTFAEMSVVIVAQ
jgi:hypothetical protein